MVITVIDTETSGLKHSIHEILEIAYVSYIFDRQGHSYILKEYEAKIKPSQIETAQPKALEINGYTEKAWKNALDAKEVLQEVIKQIDQSDILLGQNLIFDLKFINEMCQRNNIAPPDYPAYVDTKAIADKLVKEQWLQKSGMDYLCRYYSVKTKGRAHTALADCLRTKEVWDKLLEDTNEEYKLYTFEKPYQSYFKR